MIKGTETANKPHKNEGKRNCILLIFSPHPQPLSFLERGVLKKALSSQERVG
jgi:hypothetical protein